MDDNITLMEFIKFCQTTPEIIGWLEFHDDPDVFAELYDLRDSDVEREAEVGCNSLNIRAYFYNALDTCIFGDGCFSTRSRFRA